MRRNSDFEAVDHNMPYQARTDFQTLQALLPFLFRFPVRVVLAITCLVLAKVSNVGVPLVLKELSDQLTPLLQNSALLVAAVVPIGLLLTYGALRILSTLFTELREFIFARVTHSAVKELCLNVFSHLQALSLRFHLNRRTGSVTRDVERGSRAISSLISYTLYSTLPTLIEVLLVIGYLYINYDLWFSVIVAVSIVLYVVFTFKVTTWRVKFRRTMNDLDSQANSTAVDALINYETVKYFGCEEYEAKRYGDSMAAYQEAAIKSQQSLTLLNMGQSALMALAVTAVLWRATVGVLNEQLSLGDLVLINAFMIQLYIPLNFLGVIYREIKQCLVDIERLFSLLDEPCEIKDQPNAKPLVTQGATIEFHAVNFSYEAQRPILKNLSFSIPAGQTVAVVGHSGAGKSTLCRLLYRFYEVTGGQILIDGEDITEVTQASLRSQIGIVPQDTVLFNHTIGYNIGYARPGATQEEIQSAAKAASIHDFICLLPQGYETKVGERGLKLSGGEKQRVAIARAILKNPSIFVFDEATSSLDSATEKLIQLQLKELSRSRTTLIIAHRLSTIIHANKILVFKQGELFESGTHIELLNQNGQYATMWNHQQHHIE